MQSAHWNRRPSAPVQIISIDTAIARNQFPSADFLVIDECDQATSEGYKKFVAQYSNAHILGITATPYTTKGLRHIADSIVRPISMLSLVEQGYLVPFRYYAPTTPDLDKVRVSSSTKDYVNDELETAMTAGGLTGKIIDHYKTLASDRPTLLFAVNIHHSKLLVERFLRAGIKAEHADANTSQEDRNAIFKRLEIGETKVVSNVGIATRGFDAPFISCLIVARPTKSLNLHIQMLGRGTRTSPGKTETIILDHAGNLIRLGLPTDEPEALLDGKEQNKKPRESKVCKNCFAVFRAAICPECGVVPPPSPATDIEESNEKLKELINVEVDPILRFYKTLQKEAKQKGRKPSWANYKLIDKVGLETAKKYLPQWFIDSFENPFMNSPYRARGQ
jgi:superfamily II DNA or RNA helicase